ncbi:X8 domain [Dillenia turbinata]|uniref:X8 domain n=1 Tax=Dillenia turbinata TaxID=194707 RepID=A0AAN8UTC1_9MAGN
MAKIALPLSILSSLLLMLLLNSGGNSKFAHAEAPENKWCVAKPSSSNAELQNNIDYACQHVNCNIIEPGQRCYDPNTPSNHASVIMNLYYKTKGQQPINCNFRNSAVIVQTDPSYDDCKYA